MKYFIDTEFIEGFHKPLLGKKRHFIDLISIGIVCEDGRSYYAISTEFNKKDADDWVIKNVIDKLEQRATSFYDSPRLRSNVMLYKSNEKIAEEIALFCYPTIAYQFKDAKKEFLARAKDYGWIANQPEFYGYYSDYDWVLFCSLFGRMIDLPKGWPMYCIDLKQMMDEKGFDKEWKQKNCPDPEGEHNALVDAKWNYELYKKLSSEQNAEVSDTTDDPSSTEAGKQNQSAPTREGGLQAWQSALADAFGYRDPETLVPDFGKMDTSDRSIAEWVAAYFGNKV